MEALFLNMQISSKIYTQNSLLIIEAAILIIFDYILDLETLGHSLEFSGTGSNRTEPSKEAFQEPAQEPSKSPERSPQRNPSRNTLTGTVKGAPKETL